MLIKKLNIKDNYNFLYKAIILVLEKSYEDSSSLVQRAMAHNNIAYLGYIDSELICFFLVCYDKENIGYDNLYLGLSGTKHKFKKQGHVFQLYKEATNEAKIWEKDNQQKLIYWATTASPIAYLALTKLFKNIYPNQKEEITELAQDFLKKIALVHYKHNKEPYYVLKNVAEETYYSNIEKARLTKIIQKRNFTLFEQLGIYEASGDRLLVVCTEPI